MRLRERESPQAAVYLVDRIRVEWRPGAWLGAVTVPLVTGPLGVTTESQGPRALSCVLEVELPGLADRLLVGGVGGPARRRKLNDDTR